MQPTYVQGNRGISADIALQRFLHMNCLCPLFSNEIFNGVVSKESRLYTMVFKNTGNGSCFFACRSKLSPFLFELGFLVAFFATPSSVTLLP
jgi:hypothetical protein